MTSSRIRAALAALLTLVAACAPRPDGADGADAPRAGDTAATPGPDDSARLRDARLVSYADFGLRLYREVAAARGDSNVFLSPTSAALALAMTLEGAAGSTRDSLAAALGIGALSPEEATRGNMALLASLRAQQEVTLHVANALWAREGVPFEPRFLDRARQGYAAEVASLDLSSREAMDRINAWTRERTQGKIASILDEPPPGDAILLLTNAVYFRGLWPVPFDTGATRPVPFRRPAGGTVPVPTMHATRAYGYRDDDGFRVARLPYKGDRVAMYVLLPDSSSTLAALRDRLTPERLRTALDSVRPEQLALALPRFRLEQRIDLKAPLVAMGAGIAFDQARADFGRMLPASWLRNQRAFVSRAFQKTFVEVDEVGTEAAAVTGIEVSVTSAPPPPVPFAIDRPFMLVIRDDRTRELLFVGQVVDPLK